MAQSLCCALCPLPPKEFHWDRIGLRTIHQILPRKNVFRFMVVACTWHMAARCIGLAFVCVENDNVIFSRATKAIVLICHFASLTDDLVPLLLPQ